MNEFFFLNPAPAPDPASAPAPAPAPVHVCAPALAPASAPAHAFLSRLKTFPAMTKSSCRTIQTQSTLNGIQ